MPAHDSGTPKLCHAPMHRRFTRCRAAHYLSLPECVPKQAVLRPSPYRTLVAQVLRRPSLYWPALRTAWRLRERDWYRHAPFLPLPPREYVEWRLHTAYGDEGDEPSPRQLEQYLGWTRRMHRLGR
jgi:hypothetical protein